MRRRPRLPSLFLGLLFLAVALGYALSVEDGGASLNPTVVWPIVIIGIGIAGLLALVGPSERELGEGDLPGPEGDPADGGSTG